MIRLLSNFKISQRYKKRLGFVRFNNNNVQNRVFPVNKINVSEES